MTSLAYRSFVTRWVSLTVAGLAGLAAFNILVDPAGAYPHWHVQSFEPLRYLSLDRVHKAEMAKRGDWEVIILGSSRSKAGMPATYPFFVTNRTCNLSLDGVVMPELVSAFEFARRHNPVKHVILCLDLFMFSSEARWVQDFSESRFNPDFNRFSYYCLQLLGRAAADDSWSTVKRWLRRDFPPPQSQRGFYLHDIGKNTSQRELFDRVLRIMSANHSARTMDPARLEMFREIVRDCRDQGIDLQIAIMPVHALDLELVYASGRWPQFETWKRGLVAVLADEGVEEEIQTLGFHRIFPGRPSRPFRRPGDTATRMKYYCENSHCTPLVGGYMLDAMLGGPPVFGVELTRSNLDDHLAQTLKDRSHYARTNAADIAWVHTASRLGNEPLNASPHTLEEDCLKASERAGCRQLNSIESSEFASGQWSYYARDNIKAGDSGRIGQAASCLAFAH